MLSEEGRNNIDELAKGRTTWERQSRLANWQYNMMHDDRATYEWLKRNVPKGRAKVLPEHLHPQAKVGQQRARWEASSGPSTFAAAC